MNRPLVIGNWKMTGSKESTVALLTELVHGLKDIDDVDIGVCPPAIYMTLVAEALTDTKLQYGGQDLSHLAMGAHTGDIAGDMLADFSCHYVIVGHSERRANDDELTDHGESNELVAKKYQRALLSGLKPILCVGETLTQREAGETLAIVEQQIATVLNLLNSDDFNNMIIAYEPVWAIGTGKTASPEQAQAVHEFIRQQVAVINNSAAKELRILYGGSVNPENAKELFSQTDIDGGLIGGAALVSADFISICQST